MGEKGTTSGWAGITLVYNMYLPPSGTAIEDALRAELKGAAHAALWAARSGLKSTWWHKRPWPTPVRQSQVLRVLRDSPPQR